MPNGQPRILVLTASAGYGHRSAAESVVSVLRAQNPHATVEVFDTWTLLPAWQHWFYTKGYVLAGRIAPDLYRWSYRTIVNTPRFLASVKNGFLKNARTLKEYTDVFKPDVVIATHAHGAGIAHHLKEHFNNKFKLVYIYTDYHAHALLCYDAVDLYCLPAQSVATSLENLGVAPDKVAVTGVPIRAEFQAHLDQAGARRQLGLESDRFTALLMRGGHAIGHNWMTEVVRLAHRHNLATNIIAVTGTNKVLLEKLNRLVGKHAGPSRNTGIRTFGFSRDIPTLLAAADVYIGKPGGLSLSEALTVGRPLIVDRGMPGTEDGNLDFIKREKIGLEAETPREIIKHLRYLSDNKNILAEFQDRARSLGRPHAAKNIVELINKLT